MPNEILSKYGSFTAITITLNSLADAAGRQGSAVSDTSPSAPMVRVHFKLMTGTSPTNGELVEFYVSRADDDASELSDGATGASDAAYSNSKSELELVHTLQVDGTSNKSYQGSFIIVEPGTDWRLVVFNETGATLHATAGNFEVGYRTIIPEVQ
jgi:hypothetical protein